MKAKFLTSLAFALCLASGAALAGEEHEECNEGCTPGYWKQEQHFDSWPAPYTPDSNLRDIFVTSPVELIPDDTFLEALNYGGGPGVDGATQILLRQAVAALLNASSPDVGFPVSIGHVVSTTIDRIESGHRQTILNRAIYFDSINNLDCPID
jgi:hypothetical protein